MTSQRHVAVCLVFGLFLLATGCARSAEQLSGDGTVQGESAAPVSQPAGAATEGLAIEFRSDPDPPTAGDNTFEVLVKQGDGSPVTDATVTTVFSMPAMPSMNMPAMKSTATLAHEASGRYRGTGQLSMGGTWYVTVTVSRGPDQLGSRKFSMVAK